MSAAFTPGPWTSDSSGYIMGADTAELGRVFVCPEQVATARLIAAAPDLYAALDPTNIRTASKALIEAGNGLLGGLLILMADMQDAALVKARGEQVPA